MSRFLFITALLSILINHSKAQDTEYSRLRIYLDGRSVSELAALGLECDHGNFRPKLYIENDFSAAEMVLLEQNGFRYDVLIEDVVSYYQRQNVVKIVGSTPNVTCSGISPRAYNTPEHFDLGSMGGYPTYQEILDQLDSMRALYPQLISARQIINPADLTHENRPIYWLRISDNADSDEQEPEILYNALHHSREPMSVTQLLFFMWFLLENYQSDPSIQYLVNNTEMYFVPCVNPDGYVYNQTTNPNGGGLWRKNRRNNGDGTYGVDLNRNYGYAWGYNNIGSSPTSSSDTYRGPSAFSEPETRNIRDFCIAHNFQIALNYHSYGNKLIYPWAYNDQHTPDSAVYRELAPFLTKENQYITGTGVETVGYTSNGDADDWIYGEQTAKNKILSMTCETGPAGYGFWPPSSEIENLCKMTLWQNLTAAWVLLNCGIATDQTPPVINQHQTQVHFSVKRYGYQSGNLTVSVQPISSNIVSVGSPKVFNLNQFQQTQDSIALFLDTTIGNGAQVRYVLTLNNGVSMVKDTITKIFGAYSVVYQNNGDTLGAWTNLGMSSFWEVTSNDYYSAPSSITDSKTGDYPNNQTSELILTQTLDLSEASDASLSFWAKWDVEEDYDFVQILAADDNGTFQPLCGLYTNLGTDDQDENQPLYDGEQNFWVQENMSLNDYLGNSQVVIKIRLVSDQWLRADGFYFDDFVVHRLIGDMTSSMSIEPNHYPVFRIGQNQPNPASERVYIPFEPASPHSEDISLTLHFYNVLGQVWHTEPVTVFDTGKHIDIGHWDEGVYFYRVVGKNTQSQTHKMVIQR